MRKINLAGDLSVTLDSIDKSVYRKHLNLLIGASIAFLLLSSLGLSSLFIELISIEGGDNFMLNLMAVAISCAGIISAITLNKRHHLMQEIYYVWRLKMELNFINRKLRLLDKAALEGDVNALIILSFYYKASRQLWTLDDNTIAIDSLNRKEQLILTQIETKQLSIDINDYNRALLNRF